MTMDILTELELLSKIVITAVLGGVVGVERELAEKPAGTILKYGPEDPRTVEGLATGASILSVSAIGIGVALNAFILAIGVTLLNLLINWGMASLVRRVKSKNK